MTSLILVIVPSVLIILGIVWYRSEVQYQKDREERMGILRMQMRITALEEEVAALRNRDTFRTIRGGKQ